MDGCVFRNYHECNVRLQLLLSFKEKEESDEETKEETEVKTFAQIMAAKRQKQKRALEKEKASQAETKKIKKIKTVVDQENIGRLQCKLHFQL